jgi:transcriptional regulator with XRE-family HTH domain
MLLAQRLRELRARYDWTLHELAERSGVHYVTIHRAEKGSTRITAPVVIALAKTLQVTTDYLLGVDAEAPPRKPRAQAQATPAPQPPAKRPRPRKAAPVG